ncbi:MAG: UDP-N-acetylmuramoyl-L-alanine--D-glutamate ligase [Pseudomonadota bacterium]
MIPVRGYDGRKVAVLGLGRSGLAAARALRAGGAEPVCWDDGEGPRAAAEAEGFPLADLTRAEAWEGAVLLCLSPGIAHLYPEPHPAVRRAWEAGVAVDNDVGLFFRSVATEDWADMDPAPRIVCVTGSNGKSTTTALIAHILEAEDRPVQMGGNIGRGVLDLAPPEEGETLVLELSSYQIELARSLGPDIAVFLNLTPDHLDRHGGMGGYFAAKARLFDLGSPERSVIGVDQPEGRYLANRMRESAADAEPVITVAQGKAPEGRGWSVGFRSGWLAENRKGRQAASIDLREMPALQGAHNHQNACAAYAVARALGLAPRKIEAALRTFPGLPHRMERVAEAAGVLWVNDSKATNADAAEKALLSYDKIRWIAGGVPKAGGIDPLTPLLERVEKTYLIGEAAEAFAGTLGDAPHEIAGDLEAAVARASAEAEAGEVVLLSPACASFDQFPSFEARGDAFRGLARAAAAAKEPSP